MRILTLATAIALLGFCANAQDVTTANEQFPVGGAVDATAPREVIREVHGDWEIRCDGAGSNCFLYQLMLNEQGTPIAELSLVKLPVGSEAVAGATVVAPLGTLLTRGVTFSIDGQNATQYPFSWCTAPGCFARFGLTDLLVNTMQAGNQVEITLFPYTNPGAPFAVNASLTGFTAAFEALENQGQ